MFNIKVVFLGEESLSGKHDHLNYLASEGWRLICVDNSIAYLEREAEEPWDKQKLEDYFAQRTDK